MQINILFMRLPNHDRVSQTIPDAMHTVTDSMEKLFYVILGKQTVPKNPAMIICAYIMYTGKADAKGKIVNAERSRQRFGLKPTTKEFIAPWQLSSNDVKIASKRLDDIHIPDHLDFKPQFLFSHPTRLKSHDWKQVCTLLHKSI